MTYYDRNYTEIGKICEKSIKHYSEGNGFDWKIIKEDNYSGRPASWMRIKIIQELFTEGYQYVFWLDADSVFVDYRKNILDEIRNNKNMYLVQHYIEGKNVPNLGVFLIKNCHWSKDLLEKIWSMEAYINHKWWENAAFLKLIGYDSLLDEGNDHPNKHYLDKISWLDLAWNSLPLITKSPVAIINHYPGMIFKDRIRYMQKDLS